MAKTLLDGVNDVLTRARVIDSNNQLSTLNSNSHQTAVDIVVQVWNEVIDELFNSTDIPRPNMLKEATLTLVQDDRDYALASDVIQLRFPLLDETNGRYISEFPGGYLELVNSQPEPSNFTGLPIAAAIRPTDNELYLDRIPTSNEAGLVYKYRYIKDAVMASPGDPIAVPDMVYRALVPAVHELYKLEFGKDVRGGVLRKSMGRARKMLRQKPQRTFWTPIGIDHSVRSMNAFDSAGGKGSFDG